MAKANLPVNFKDDILKENMNGKRRFNMIQNSDGTVSFEDVTDYTQVGSTFGAAQINATNEAVNNAADASKIIDSLETIKANTQSGYIAGALAVKKLSSNLMSNLIPCEYGAYGSSASVTITKPTSFTSSTYTLLVFTSEDYRATETYSISGATLLQTISGSRYAIYYDQKYRMYSVSGSNVTISFSHGNTNAGLSYVLIDRDFTSMSLATEPIAYSNNNRKAVYVSCNMSDNRGYSYIDSGSLGYVCHLATPTNEVNFSTYYTNIFTVYTLLEDGYVKMNRSGTNQYGNTLILS